ncbi:MAG: Hsp33 family molecular chaperone HslO [Bacteriovoracaceae bacterium]|jgi:molecular chaperone Hsp33|nr:Hsp33 family molecular chaperone HslO [Bacteriovoracaceae bacterium]
MKESRLYSFLNNDIGFNVHVIDGKKILEELAKIHFIGPVALPYFNNTVLSSMQMINFLKPGENLGIYIDSEEPYFRFKIEMGHSGKMRTLLLPEEFKEFPHTLNGISRISKIYNGKQPYTSVVEMKDSSTTDIINNILAGSYQTNSKILVDANSHNALMITKLPRKEIKRVIEDEFEDISIDTFMKENKDFLHDVLHTPTIEIENLVNTMESNKLMYIGSKELMFHCPCSKERMSTNLLTLHANDLNEIFEDKNSIEIRCDYCNTIYDIEKPVHN